MNTQLFSIPRTGEPNARVDGYRVPVAAKGRRVSNVNPGKRLSVLVQGDFPARCLQVLLVFVVCIAAGCADPNTILKAVEKRYEPLVKALADYKMRHGEYPQSLEILLSEVPLSGIPERPSRTGVKAMRNLSYHVSPCRGMYMLSLAYKFPHEFRTPIMSYDRISYEDAWRMSKYPYTFDRLVAGFAGARYQHLHLGSDLQTSIDALIRDGTNTYGTPECLVLPRAWVVKALGTGICETAGLPLAGCGTAFRYAAEDEDCTYWVTYSTGTYPWLAKYHDTLVVDAMYRGQRATTQDPLKVAARCETPERK